MKNKQIILISIIGLLIIGFISLYNSLDIPNHERGEKDNYFNRTLKRVVPQNIKNYIKDTIFVFKKVSVLEQKLADKNKQLTDKNKQLLDKNNEISNFLNDLPFFKFKKKEKKQKPTNCRG